MLTSNHTSLINEIKKLTAKELQTPQRKQFIVMTAKIVLNKILYCDSLFSYFTFYLLSWINRINPNLYYLAQTGNIGVILGGDKTSCYDRIKPELLTKANVALVLFNLSTGNLTRKGLSN